MNNAPLRHEEVTELLFTMTSRLSALVLWLLIACLHLAIATLVMYGLWATELTPTAAIHGFHWLLQTKPLATLGVVGVSALGVIAGYAKLLRWLHRQSHRGWLYDYLTKMQKAA